MEERIKESLRKKEGICWIGIGAGKVMEVAGSVSNHTGAGDETMSDVSFNAVV